MSRDQRQQQRAASKAAILEASWDLFARIGPDGASMRDVGRAAGCTHALVTRYYGSKDGLVTAVSDELTRRMRSTVEHVEQNAPDPVVGLLSAGRERPSCVQLLVRCGLGDLRPEGFGDCLDARRVLSSARPDVPLGRSRRTRLCGYAAASLMLGWLTFEGFLVAATGLGQVASRRRDEAMAGAVHHLLSTATSSGPALRARVLAPGRDSGRRPGEELASSRDALLRSAIELFAARGPASVSVRDVSRHAGANPGLIYRHFGSKEALLEEAIEEGSSDLFPAALTPEGFDFDSMSQQLHTVSPAPRLIARTLVDGIDIRTVRRRFPVLRRLLDDLGPVPVGARPVGLSDPRVAVAATAGMTLGSSVWGPHLRPAFGLADDDAVDAAIADLARHLMAQPGSVPGGADDGDRR